MSAFAVRNLSVSAYAQGWTAWHYKAPAATLADVMAPGFFNSVADIIAAGDHIHVSAADGGAILFVSYASDVVVTTAPMCHATVAVPVT